MIRFVKEIGCRVRKRQYACYQRYFLLFSNVLKVLKFSFYWYKISLKINKLLNKCIRKILVKVQFHFKPLQVVRMAKSIFDRVQNTVEKGEKCWLPAFPPFPTKFSKGFNSMVIETLVCGKKNR